MRRPTRALKAEACELEGRLLMASNPPPSPVQFVGSTGGDLLWPTQIVTQQAGKATVTLSRTDTAGPLQVEVTTDPNFGGAAPGGNAGAADQTVTFAPGQSLATVTVPIIAGAPNPGEVDVLLDVKPVNAADPLPGLPPRPLDLKIVASDPTLPPEVVDSIAANQGIVLIFNKPMDPVGASNVNNYSVFVVNLTARGGFLGFLSTPKNIVKSVRFESAQYDPVTQTATLITKHPILGIGSEATWSQVKRARRSVRTAHSSNVAPGLTDLQGNPINADTTPGKVEYRVVNGPIPV